MPEKILHPRPGALGTVLLLAAALPLFAADADRRWVSKAGLFKAGYEVATSPPPLNRIHDWQLILEEADGTPVANAEIRVSGGMPAHDHGLPTEPRVTEYLGDGRYRLEGMRFHMMGDWEITLDIEAGEASDTVIIPLSL